MIAENNTQTLNDSKTLVGNGYCGNSNLLLKENNCSPVILPHLVIDFENNCMNKQSCSFNSLNPFYFDYKLSNNKC